MTSPLRLWLLVAATVGISASSAAERYIVTLRPGTEAKNVADKMKVKPRHTYRHALRGFAAELDDEKVARLKKRKDVLAVERDGRVELCEQTIGAGIIRMGLTNYPFARINGLDERIDVDVAVIDTGIQPDHPDLNVVFAMDFSSDGNVADRRGHGTRMAGVIGALDNDFGVVGVAPGARLWSLKFSSAGAPADAAFWSAALAAFDYVGQHGGEIEVVNCSFGGGQTPSVAVRAAVSNVVSQGIVVVAATGNLLTDIIGRDRLWGTADDFYPAALRETMAVSNVNPTNDTFSLTSNYSSYDRPGNFVVSAGGAIDVAAPGIGIISTYTNSSYVVVSNDTVGGTSMSCAHVSGLVALYIAANGRATNAEGVYRIRQAIVDSALPQSAWEPNYPYGDADTFLEPLAIASEAWIPALRILTQTNTPSGFQFTFPTVPGYSYAAQRIRSLSGSDKWSSLTSIMGTGTSASVFDPDPGTNAFYRVLRQSSVGTTPSHTYEWRFASALEPSIGHGVLQFADVTTSNLTSFGVTDGTGVPHVGAQPASYMVVPQLASPSNGYLVTFASSGANGGGARINQYTIIQDILVPTPLGWAALFNADVANINSAGLNLFPTSMLGTDAFGYYTAVWGTEDRLPTNTWLRVAFTADLAAGVVRYYVDGKRVFEYSGASARDGVMTLESGTNGTPGLRLFNEPTGLNTHALYVSAWAFVDRTLTMNEIGVLGGSKASGIFVTNP